MHSKAFDGLKGNFPIGFLVWQTSHGDGTLSQIGEVTVEVLDKNARPIGEKKFYNLPKATYLGEWIKRPRSNSVEAISLKNAITPGTNSKDVRGTKWADGAIGSMLCAGNDIQPASTLTALLSSGFSSAGAFFVTPENLSQAAIIFSVRRLIKPTWINDRDQFLIPTESLTPEFQNDCLIWMLFNGSNLTASANDLEWNDRKWSIVNHFIPFSEQEVGSDERFESSWMVDYLADRILSVEAVAVMDAGRRLWQAYHTHIDTHTVRDELKLNRADVGWYQVRNALKKRNESGDFAKVDFSAFEESYTILSEKLRPMVYDLGFLRR